MKLRHFAVALLLAGWVAAPTVLWAQPGTFTEWDAIASGQPVRDFNPHITVLDRTGNTGFTPNTPWYTIDNRTPGLPCALGHLEPSTDTLISWGYGGGVPVGVDVDDVSGRVWVTVSGLFIPGTFATVGFKHPGAANNMFRQFPGTSATAGLVLDANGDAWVAEAPNRILKITPSGSATRYTIPSVSQPRYLGFDSTGDFLYFTTAASRNINRLDITTGDLVSWAYPAIAPASFSILDAYGILVQADDAIWFADTLGDVVCRLNPTTNVITTFSAIGMNDPTFIAISNADQLFVTERFGNTVDIGDIALLTGVDTPVAPSTIIVLGDSFLSLWEDIDRPPISRVQLPVVTPVIGTPSPVIVRFPVPTLASQPIGMTDVVETAVGPLETKIGVFGSEFSFSSSKIFVFESSIIIPPDPNEPPVCAAPESLTVFAGATVDFTVSGSDPDVDDELTLSTSGLPTGASADPALPATGTGSVSSDITWPTGAGDRGTNTITFTVADEDTTVECSVVVTVLNNPPACDIDPEGPLAVFAGETVEFTVSTSDPDGDDITLTSGSLPAGAVADPVLPATNGTTVTWETTAADRGEFWIGFLADDGFGGTAVCSIHVEVLNNPPDCDDAAPSVEEIWPPNHKMVGVSILGVTDADGDAFTITITSITQDEPLNTFGDGNFEPDGDGIGTSVALVRAERSGTKKVPGNGRVYAISFTADDGQGGTCDATVSVCVPHDQRKGHVCIDDGQVYDSVNGGAPAAKVALGSVSSDFAVDNIPNPFNPSTTIRYTLPEEASVRLVIFNSLGQRVRALVQEVQSQGSYSVVWDGRDASGREVTSGIYIYRLEAGQNVATRKMLLAK